jgi:hypothetical protein
VLQHSYRHTCRATVVQCDSCDVVHTLARPSAHLWLCNTSASRHVCAHSPTWRALQKSCTHTYLTLDCHNFGWWMDWLDAHSVSTYPCARTNDTTCKLANTTSTTMTFGKRTPHTRVRTICLAVVL